MCSGKRRQWPKGVRDRKSSGARAFKPVQFTKWKDSGLQPKPCESLNNADIRLSDVHADRTAEGTRLVCIF